MVGSRAGSLLLWENASLKVTSMVSINLALLFPSRLLGFVTARAPSFFSPAICVFGPIIIIPATAPWIVLSINILSKLPGIHPLSYSVCIFQLFCPLGLTNVLLHSNTTFRVPSHTCHLGILSSQFSSEDSYIGIVFTSFSTDSNYESSADSQWVSNHSYYGWERFSHDRSRLYGPCALRLKPNCNNIGLVYSTLSLSLRSLHVGVLDWLCSKLFILYYLWNRWIMYY